MQKPTDKQPININILKNFKGICENFSKIANNAKITFTNRYQMIKFVSKILNSKDNPYF